MHRLRWTSVLLIPATYVVCAMLIGTLLGSKAYQQMTPIQEERLRESAAFAFKYQVHAKYIPTDFLNLLDEPAQLTFLTREELGLVLERAACHDQRIYFQDPQSSREFAPAWHCIQTIPRLDTYDKDYPVTYFVPSVCYPLWPHAAIQDEKSFSFHDPETCLEASATAIQWKGFFDLKAACQAEATRIHPQYANEKAENLVRHCIAENARKWHERERERCYSRKLWPTQSCKF